MCIGIERRDTFPGGADVESGKTFLEEAHCRVVLKEASMLYRQVKQKQRSRGEKQHDVYGKAMNCIYWWS